MKRRKAGFTLVELMIATVLLGVAGVVMSQTFVTISVARLRSEINSEVTSWHNYYAGALSKGVAQRGATSATAPATQTFTLPSGISVTVTDTFSAPDAALPSLLRIQSAATWALPSASGSGNSTITVMRMTEAQTL